MGTLLCGGRRSQPSFYRRCVTPAVRVRRDDSGMAESREPGAPEHPLFARIYERLLAGSEEAGLADMRRSLLSRASGRTLEIGAGTGLDLPHYTDAVTDLVLAEPDPHM